MKKIIMRASIVLILFIIIAYLLNEISQSRNFQFLGTPVTHVETEQKVVALTFDDGPGVHTEDILAILDGRDVKGTFFLTGQEIEEQMEEAAAIVEAGHEVGNHTYSHARMIFRSPTFIAEEIERTDELIRELDYEEDNILFRPPNGRKLFLLPYYLEQQDRKTIMWNIEPETELGMEADAEQLTNYVVETVEPGSIVLLHVMYPGRIESLHAVEDIISSLQNKGYEFVTVSELIEYD